MGTPAKPGFRGIRVYIAGPYGRGDVATNVNRAVLAWHELWDAGFIPFCPHAFHLFHLLRPRPEREWMAYDLLWLPFCDALLRLDGESPGADDEVAKARELHIPVYRSVGDLLAAFPAGTAE